MNTLEIQLASAEATASLGEVLGAGLRSGECLALVGPMGAGKTTLARGFARGAGVDDPEEVASPTYLLVVEHPGDPGLVHVDAYLPEKTRGFLEEGGSDYLAEAPGILLVEWADRIVDLLPRASLTVHLVPVDGGRLARVIPPDDGCFTRSLEPLWSALGAFSG